MALQTLGQSAQPRVVGDKSKIQLAMAEREPLVVEGGSKEIPRDVPHQVAKGWDRHKDMVSMQAMVVRIVTELYNLFPADFGAAVAKEESLVRNLREHVTFYCQQTDWPMKEDKEVTDAVEAIMCYEMQLALRLVYDINEDLQRLLAPWRVSGHGVLEGQNPASPEYLAYPQMESSIFWK
ncbi:Hypothetical protein (Fragment) [Durusdinium trenchii]|uniref:Uncharacterized protein n=1 Tax=Durusdinium trenchii TaxID=1381693 RepID=A0ABP0ICS4_9DINO